MPGTSKVFKVRFTSESIWADVMPWAKDANEKTMIHSVMPVFLKIDILKNFMLAK